MPNPKRAAAAGAAAALAAMVAIVLPHTARFEGERRQAYVDRIGRGRPLTICDGHTGPDVRLGQQLSHEQCLALLRADEAQAGRAVAACSPEIVPSGPAISRKTYFWAAATDFAFNAGAGRWCGSRMARLFRAGRDAEACAAFNLYVTAGGRRFAGLVARRADLSALCREGLAL